MAVPIRRTTSQYRHVRSVTVHDLLRQWNSFEEDVGYSNVIATWRDPSPVIDPRYSLFARREMRRQGWLGPHGGGLGKTLQGVTEPLYHKTGQPRSQLEQSRTRGEESSAHSNQA